MEACPRNASFSPSHRKYFLVCAQLLSFEPQDLRTTPYFWRIPALVLTRLLDGVTVDCRVMVNELAATLTTEPPESTNPGPAVPAAAPAREVRAFLAAVVFLEDDMGDSCGLATS